MVQMIEANWLIAIVALVIALLIAWWLFTRATKPKPRERRPDVLDENAAPAQRNQALIDAPPAAAVPPPIITPPAATGAHVGIGELATTSAREQAQAAQHAEPPAESRSPQSPAESLAPQTIAAEPTPVVEPSPSEASGEPDDLRRIKGIGPKLATTLHALGITHYAQIAAWTDADIDALDANLGAFAGRPRRDSWVEQARLLSSGDTAAYEAKFGKL